MAVVTAALLCGAPFAAAQDIRVVYAAGGPADAAAAAFVRMVNDNGGVGGRPLALVARAEQGAAYAFNPLSGTPSARTEGRIVARYIVDNIEGPRVAVLYQNDEMGRQYLEGLRTGLGDAVARLISRVLPYETGAASVETQVTQLRGTGANVFVNFSTAKFASQSIRKVHELNWKAVHILASAGASIPHALGPAGLDTAKGIISAQAVKTPGDPQWRDDREHREWRDWMQNYLPRADTTDPRHVQVYVAGHLLVERIKRGGALQGVRVPMLLPGLTATAAPGEDEPIRQMRMTGFSGDRWQMFGPPLGPGVPPSAGRSSGTAGAK